MLDFTTNNKSICISRPDQRHRKKNPLNLQSHQAAQVYPYLSMWLTSVFIFQVSLAQRDDSSFEWQSSDLSSAPTIKNKTKKKISTSVHWVSPETLAKCANRTCRRRWATSWGTCRHIVGRWPGESGSVPVADTGWSGRQQAERCPEVARSVSDRAGRTPRMPAACSGGPLWRQRARLLLLNQRFKLEQPCPITQPKMWSVRAAGLKITKLWLYSSLSVIDIRKWWGKMQEATFQHWENWSQ